tara:strand:- start:5623 stop:5862 length:240 start_codon:yes stop_codon:yes gene_type:complete
MKNYGFTLSFSQRRLDKRVRGGSVYRTRKQASSEAKRMRASAKGFGISNIRVVKATKKEYDASVRRYYNDIINSRPPRK